MNTQTDLSIVIVNYNTKELTLSCIESIKKNTREIKYEMIVVDNGSQKDQRIDGSIFNDRNLGFSKANNIGIRKAKGRYILLLNSDTLLHDNVLGEMVEWMEENQKIGIATCALKNKDGSLQGTGGYFPNLLRVFSWMTIQDLPYIDTIIKPFHPMKEKSLFRNDQFYKIERELDWVTGAFMMIRRKVVDQITGLDEDYFMYTEDTDFCFRARKAGWKVVYNPKWSITHLGGKSSTKEFPLLSEYKGLKTFYKKHYPGWQYPILRFLLKIGALWRMVFLGILEGGEAFRVYAKAFKQA